MGGTIKNYMRTDITNRGISGKEDLRGKNRKKKPFARVSGELSPIEALNWTMVGNIRRRNNA